MLQQHAEDGSQKFTDGVVSQPTTPSLMYSSQN